MDKLTGHFLYSLTLCESMDDVRDCIYWFAKRSDISSDTLGRVRQWLDEHGIAGGFSQMQKLEKRNSPQSTNLAG